MIDEKMKKVIFWEKGSNNFKESKGVPFLFTYPSFLNCLSRIIKDNLNILCMNREAKGVFPSGPIVLCTSARRISIYLVRAKLCPLEKCVGSRQCKNHRCEVFTNAT